MSRLLINEYLGEIARLRVVSGSTIEGIISEAFKDLLKRWSRGRVSPSSRRPPTRPA